ncbi:MAG: tetratricopeptide repeat protein [Chthoniobacteraceae bacterium]
MDGTGAEQAQMQRGILLMEQGRYADAANFFREALAQNPLNAMAFNRLAVCELQLPDRKKQALEAINCAIEREPNESFHHAVKSFVLSALDRDREALTAAREAIALDPFDVSALHAEAQALLALARWAEAEQTARRALEMDADDSTAANQLAVALRLQNKMAENAAQISGMLARDPEDASTHANAGWAALQRGDRVTAEKHFLEALRLDSQMISAREGLLHSFRARSPLYRGYLNYCFFMQRFKKGSQFLIIFGLMFGFRLITNLATQVSMPLGIGLSALYLLFVFWVWIARGVGNFILLFDRFAKHALWPGEKREAWFVGGGAVFGLLGVITGYAIGSYALMFMAGGVLCSIIPLSLTFTNPSKPGSIFFGLIGSLGYLEALCVVSEVAFPNFVPAGLALSLLYAAAIGAIATTWLGNVPFLRR